MKKIFSLVLAALMTVSALVSCAPAAPRLNDSITLASSDAAEYAAWLDERLDVIPNEITLGVGSSDSYGVDMTAFADDGYVLRSIGDEVIAFGKTDAGLDRAVRAYAKAVEDGQTNGFNTVYNEGPRVKRLTIAGRDISEYSIRLSADADRCHRFAAAELQSFIGKACGFYPEIVTEDKAHMMILEQVLPGDSRYDVLGDEGYTFTVKANGDFCISGGQYRGCLYGVYEFLEKYIGWRFLYDYANVDSFAPDYMNGCVDYLYEAEHIDIPADLDETQTPDFDSRLGVRSVYDYGIRQKYNYGLNSSPYMEMYNGYGINHAACHGLQSGPYKDFIDYDETCTTQPCFTNKYNLETAVEYYTDYINAKLKAGQTVGKEIVDIDVSQNDSPDFCTCKTCTKYYKAEGGHVGHVLYFTNAIAEAVAEIDPRIGVLMLAYMGTSSVPKTMRPADNVSIAYCFYVDLGRYVCYNHPLDGDQCNASSTNVRIGNKPYAEEIRGWNEITKRIIVWYYPGVWSYTTITSPIMENLYYDMQFFASLENVRGVYTCPSGCRETSGYISTEEMIAPYVLSKLMWDADITYEEYNELIREFYYIMCGDGCDYLMDYFFLLEQCENGDCWSTLDFGFDYNDRMNYSIFLGCFDQMVDLFADAHRLAQTKRQEDYVENLSLTMYFTGLCSAYKDWYVNGDSALREKYARRYEYLKDIALEHNLQMRSYGSTAITITEEHFDIEKSLEELFRA